MTLNKKKNVGLFIYKKDYIPSWLGSGVLSELKNECNVIIFTTPDLIKFVESNSKEWNYPNIEVVKIASPQNSFSSSIYSFLLMLSMRRRSSSINFRLTRMKLGELRFFPRPYSISGSFFALKYNFKSFFRYFFTLKYLSFLRLFVPLVILVKIFEKYYNKEVYSISETLPFKLDWAVLPSGANEIYIYRLIKELSAVKIKTILCLENWDNLTSKSSVISKPDYIFVMGNNCKELATNVQNLDPKTIIVSGLPRFNLYRNYSATKKSEAKSILKNNISVLYLGCSMPHNEINFLNSLTAKLNKSTYKNKYSFKYKPHPSRRPRFFESKHLDNKVEIIKNFSQKMVPVIDQSHISLLSDPDIVIATPTTMLIEAMILGKNIIVDATNDGVHRTTAALALKKYDHLNSVYSQGSLKICNTLDDVVVALEELSGNKTVVEYSLENMIENREKNYGTHLLKVILNK